MRQSITGTPRVNGRGDVHVLVTGFPAFNAWYIKVASSVSTPISGCLDYGAVACFKKSLTPDPGGCQRQDMIDAGTRQLKNKPPPVSRIISSGRKAC